MSLRRLRLLGAAFTVSALLVASPLAVLSSPASADTTAPGDDPGTDPAPVGTIMDIALSVATFNTAATQSTARAMHDINLIIARQPDVVTLQEMASPTRRQLVRQTITDCETCIYDAYMPVPAVPGSTPILYRSDRFRLLHVETKQVTGDTYVGKKGAGPSTIHAKYINWVELRDLATGRIVNVLNNHAVPSVQSKSGGPNRHMAKRLGIYRLHMIGLRALIEQISSTTGGLMFVNGDLNVNFRRDKVLQPRIFPYYNLGLENMRASYDLLGMPKQGTHTLNGNGTRLIDYVYVGTRKAIKPVSEEVVMGAYSDHRPLLVRFTVSTLKPVTSDPTQPTDPTGPTDPADPTDPTNPTTPPTDPPTTTP